MVGLIVAGGVCLRWLVSSPTNEFSIGGASVSVAGMGPSRMVGRARRCFCRVQSAGGCKLTTQGLEHQDPDRSVFLLFSPPSRDDTFAVDTDTKAVVTDCPPLHEARQ